MPKAAEHRRIRIRAALPAIPAPRSHSAAQSMYEVSGSAQPAQCGTVGRPGGSRFRPIPNADVGILRRSLRDSPLTLSLLPG